MWMAFDHLKADSTKFALYALEIQKVTEFFLFLVLDATFTFLQIITLDAVLNNSAYLNSGTS